jgi:hypothetical protein
MIIKYEEPLEEKSFPCLQRADLAKRIKGGSEGTWF